MASSALAGRGRPARRGFQQAPSGAAGPGAPGTTSPAPTALAQTATPQAPAPPTGVAAPLIHGIEIGSGIGSYDNGLGHANDQSVRYRLSKANDFGLTLDMGRERRFGETSINGGWSFSKSLAGGTTVNAGWGTGSGQVLAPSYRFDVGVTRPIGGALANVGYTRVQSKAENASNGIGAGVVQYFTQWIVGGNVRVDVGSPGRTVSTSAGLNATWYQWKKTYIGGGLSWGDVSYTLLLQGGLVNYRAYGANASVSRWLSDSAGVNVGVSYGHTPLYQVSGIRVSVFRDF